MLAFIIVISSVAYLAMIVATIGFCGYMRGRVVGTSTSGYSSWYPYTTKEKNERDFWQCAAGFSFLWPAELLLAIFIGISAGIVVAVGAGTGGVFSYGERSGKQSVERKTTDTKDNKSIRRIA